MRALLARVTLGNREMTLNEQMQLADKFALVNNHAWRPAHYLMIGTDAREHIDSAGMVMIEMLAGKYQVCRVEPFFYPAHVCGFTGDKVEAYTDFEPKY